VAGDDCGTAHVHRHGGDPTVLPPGRVPGVPDALLPAALKMPNPLDLPRRVDAAQL
jgi:hypothetical protein